jgi:hypothetical protein
VIDGDVAVDVVVPGVSVAGLGKLTVPGIWVPMVFEQVLAEWAARTDGLQE